MLVVSSKAVHDDKGLKDSAMIKQDHVHRQVMRQLSLDCGQDDVIVVCQAGLLAEVLEKNRGKHYNAVVNLAGGAQERNCFHADFTEDLCPDSVKRRAQLAAAILQKNTNDRRRESLRFISESRRHLENVENYAAFPAVPPYSAYRRGLERSFHLWPIRHRESLLVEFETHHELVGPKQYDVPNHTLTERCRSLKKHVARDGSYFQKMRANFVDRKFKDEIASTGDTPLVL